MAQYVRDLVDDGTPRPVEAADGGVAWRGSAHALSAFVSCARQLGVDPELVAYAASIGRLGELIERRSGIVVEQRGLVRLQHMYRRRELAARQVTPW